MTNEITESTVVEMDVELEVYDKVSAAVDAAMERCANIVLQYDTPSQVKSSRGWIYRNLNKLNPVIDQAHKIGKAEALKFTQAMDTKKNELRGKVAKQIEEKYAPIKFIEDAEAKKKAEEEAKIKAEEERMEAERVAEMEAVAKKLADDQEELRQKQLAFERKERETRITEEVKRKAESDVEEAKKRAGRKAINDMLAAEERHRADIQREREEASRVLAEWDRRVEEEQRIAREEKAAEEMAETKRINDTAHRLAVNTEVYDAFKGIADEQCAQAIFIAIKDGNIPHVTINY